MWIDEDLTQDLQVSGGKMLHASTRVNAHKSTYVYKDVMIPRYGVKRGLVPNCVVGGSNPAWAGFQCVKTLTCYCLWGRDITWGPGLCGAYLTGMVKNHH